MGHDYFQIITIFTLFSATNSHAYSNISFGSSLYAGQDDNNNPPWLSPSGDFAFGFLPYQNQFILAIWFSSIPEKTIVWSANGKNPVQKDSKLELSADTGLLSLTDPTGLLIWNSSISRYSTAKNDSLITPYAAMLDNGNFMVVSSSGDKIWESFRYPTDTILPGQILKTGDLLWAMKSETDYRPGRFELRLLSNGSLVMNQIYAYTSNPYDAFYEISNVSQLGFNDLGHVYLQMLNGSLTDLLTPVSVDSDLFFRATLNFDGTFTLYSRLKTVNGSWNPLKTIPDNICLSFAVYYGSGPCGFNSYCELRKDGRPVCRCAPGFSLLNSNDSYGGCKMDYKGFGQDCNEVGSVKNEDFYYFSTLTGVDWPLTAYEKLYPSTEYDCENSCRRDCYCAVAIYQPPDNSTDGTCWKKRLPLSNGRFDPTGAINRTAIFKLPKSNSSIDLPGLDSGSNSDKDKKGTLILSSFLVTSVIFNFFSIAAIFMAAFFLYPKSKNHLDLKNPDTNLRSFSYEQLELATDGFKEELGKGAFGTVYKGLLDSSSSSGIQIAVKKLDKIVQEGEKEFKTEVNVIGQTHHKNLVRLIGYCQEGENRLLVYEFMHKGSLSSFLFKPPTTIKPPWKDRVNISFGIARGLLYLHDECNTQIIHCDIKSQNILLDNSLTAKISDFGLAKLMMNNHSRTLTQIRGTRGYVAPEWFKNIPITVKVDVYSFGVVLFEIISCKRSLAMKEEESVILSDWAFECFSDGKLEELVDGDVGAVEDAARLERMVMVGLWCVQDEPGLRPSMREVSLMLEGIIDVPVPPCPYSSSVNSFS
ncbi:G-type lectin S-receptor-like serine/threonine-protein kinase LECRK3 [Impatiens glandulifera]|uniref:G-type lectin S-receptor-like serine/threonine-protein kinase LECRK3 n=1 Tax=Impatiens glandulifera TaxID=253017 RepID=UPI001FB0F3EB|nr:G-type lectin S-receptor-like serine/threonine-protein kinase LECRK3 [Impatiens glandulifera]